MAGTDSRETRSLISVVIPVRNAEKTLTDSIDSVFSQTWQDWELVLVNDGSTDRSAEIIADYARRDSRVKIISTSPLGIVNALREGCKASTGRWIARMDGDDEMHPQRLAAQLEHADQNPELGVISCLVNYGGNAPGYAAHVDWLNQLGTPEEISQRRFIEAPLAHPSVMFRSELLDLHGGYREGDFPEDYELWLRWLDAGVKFGKVPQTLLTWNDPSERLSRTDPRYSVERFYELKCEYLAKWLQKHLSPRRDIWLWGAGRITRRRFDSLDHSEFRFQGFIDIDPKKIGRHRDGREVVLPENLPPTERAFLIVGVGNRGSRDLIADYLISQGFIEGRDFLIAA